MSFRLPGAPWADGYVVEVDTATDECRHVHLDAGKDLTMPPRSAVVLRAT